MKVGYNRSLPLKKERESRPEVYQPGKTHQLGNDSRRMMIKQCLSEKQENPIIEVKE